MNMEKIKTYIKTFYGAISKDSLYELKTIIEEAIKNKGE